VSRWSNGIAVISDLSGPTRSLASHSSRAAFTDRAPRPWGQWPLRTTPSWWRQGAWRWKSPRRPSEALIQGSRNAPEQQQGGLQARETGFHRAGWPRGDVEERAEDTEKAPGSSDGAGSPHQGRVDVGAIDIVPGSRCGGSSPVRRRFSNSKPRLHRTGLRSRAPPIVRRCDGGPSRPVSAFQSLNVPAALIQHHPGAWGPGRQPRPSTAKPPGNYPPTRWAGRSASFT